MALLDHRGNPIASTRETALRQALAATKRQLLRARYDAAQTGTHNTNHWANADHLDPHSANSLQVRRVLRSRSRYEVIENNPFLKGTLLTLAADFVGTGPKLQITDQRLSNAQRTAIENRFMRWAKRNRLRHKLWQMTIAKIVDGETFAVSYTNPRSKDQVKLSLQVIECDRVTSPHDGTPPLVNADIDGLRIDLHENPLEYYILDTHPGGSSYLLSMIANLGGGRWVPADHVVHWFRQDRGWLRGIPELTPSLPLCAVLRRYTLAVCRHAETAADLTAIVETEGPASPTPWTDGGGNMVEDDPFDTFPIEMGMIMNLPWGYKIKQLNAVPLGVQYDEYVGSVLREIIRPLCVPHNIAAGTSKDQNMASAVVDTHIYRGSQLDRRHDCGEIVLDPIFEQWWREAVLVPGYLGEVRSLLGDEFGEMPDHVWMWDAVGLEHTDPKKVADALKVLHDKRFITDRDIQEGRYNRSLEEWREQVQLDDEFRKQLSPLEQAANALLPGDGSNDDGSDDDETNGEE